MAIKDIIGRGFGFVPGSVKFIITRGFAIAIVLGGVYTDADSVGRAYDTPIFAETNWDDDDTQWDVNGNVSESDWDVPAVASYAAQSGSSPGYVEQ